jgi:hypothetical protein
MRADFPEGTEFFHNAECTQRVEDFDEHPVRTADGDELEVYDGNGNQIDREEAIVNRARPLGILLNLRKATRMFTEEHEDLFSNIDIRDYDDEAAAAIRGRNRHYAYPLAFTKDAGNIQAGRPPNHMYEVQKLLNDKIKEDGDLQPREAIQLINCSYYNEASHQFRDTTRNHDCSRGYMTAAAIGQGLTAHNDHQQFLKARENIHPLLPFERFNQKIHTVGQFIGMRLEQNYVLDLEEFPDDKKNGK